MKHISVLTIDVFEISIEDIHPSQLYINREKLKSVKHNIKLFGFESLDPVPIKQFGDLMVLIDGHTRALAQFQMGNETIKACWEDLEMDWREYKICIAWCIEENISSIKDLQNRIISDDNFQILWIDRCQRMKDELD